MMESINDATYFLNIEEGKFFSSNGTASFILSYMKKPRLIADMLIALEKEFINFDKDSALSFIFELINKEVIEEVNEEN